MTDPVATDAAIDELAAALHGSLLRPDDPGYDAARSLWNGMVDQRPALIARCLGAADVMAALAHARRHGLKVTVRGGGHGVAGKAVRDGALMLDLSALRGVRVDPQRRTARVEPGARLGDLDAEAQAFGLAVPAGVDSRTGVAGLTLGGGQGYLSRSFGLTVDNLVGADVVTADGTLHHVSASDRPDLFWALRGGGGGFGVVTSFEFQLHPAGPEVMCAQIFHPAEDAAAVLRGYRDFMAGAPDAVAIYAIFAHLPPVAPFPESHQGKPVVALVGCHSGDIEAGRRALAPLADIGEPVFSVLAPLPYRTLQSSFDAGAPDGGRFYWKSAYLKGLDDDAIDVVAARAGALPGPYSIVFLEPLGGAVARVANDSTAFVHRQAAWSFGISSGWSDPAADQTVIEWTREFHRAMTPFGTGGTYVNYQDFDERESQNAAFGGNRERLAEIRRRYDPEGLFG